VAPHFAANHLENVGRVASGNRKGRRTVQVNVRVALPFVLLAVVTAGCGSGGMGEPAEEPESAPSREGLVLKIEQLPGEGPAAPSTPTLALYEDGRVFRPDPKILIYPGPVLTTFSVTQSSPEQADEVLTAVREADVLDAPPVEDEPAQRTGTTVVTAYVDGELRTVWLRSDSAEAERLQAALQDVPVTGERPYTPEAVAVFVYPAKQPGAGPDWLIEPTEPSLLEWPLGPPRPGCSVLRGADTQRVLAAAGQAHQLTRWRSGGSLYTVAFRPLLPGESSCADIAS
jgi:hypothetical protein